MLNARQKEACHKGFKDLKTKKKAPDAKHRMPRVHGTGRPQIPFVRAT